MGAAGMTCVGPEPRGQHGGCGDGFRSSGPHAARRSRECESGSLSPHRPRPAAGHHKRQSPQSARPRGPRQSARSLLWDWTAITAATVTIVALQADLSASACRWWCGPRCWRSPHWAVTGWHRSDGIEDSAAGGARLAPQPHHGRVGGRRAGSQQGGDRNLDHR